MCIGCWELSAGDVGFVNLAKSAIPKQEDNEEQIKDNMSYAAARDWVMLVGIVDILNEEGYSKSLIGHASPADYRGYTLLVKESAMWSGGYKVTYRVPFTDFELYSLGNSKEQSENIYNTQKTFWENLGKNDRI